MSAISELTLATVTDGRQEGIWRVSLFVFVPFSQDGRLAEAKFEFSISVKVPMLLMLLICISNTIPIQSI